MIDTKDVGIKLFMAIQQRYVDDKLDTYENGYDEELRDYMASKVGVSDNSDVITLAYKLNSMVQGRESDVFSNLIFSLVDTMGSLQSHSFFWEIEPVEEPTIRLNSVGKIDAIVTDYETSPLRTFCHAYSVFKTNFVKENTVVMQKLFDN